MRILVARSGGLGDCLLTLPVLDELNSRYPGAVITVLGTVTMRAVATIAGYNSLIDLDDPLFTSLYSPGSEAVSESLEAFFAEFDRVYLFTAYPQPDTLIRRVINAGAGFCRALDPRPNPGTDSHIIDRLMSILYYEGEHCEVIRPWFVRAILAHLRTGTGTGVLIHPGSGGKGKTWPLDRYLDLADHLDEELTFVLGPVECERGLIEELAHKGYPVVTPATIDELAHMVASARVFIGNDSGAGHLAGMCGTPAVILYGPTDPNIWRPIGQQVRTVVTRDGLITGITTDDVLAAVQSFL